MNAETEGAGLFVAPRLDDAFAPARARWFSLAAGTFLLACIADPGDRASTVRDSAGIRVVVNQRPRWTGESGWRLSDEPTLAIGAHEGDSAYLFHGILSTARLRDGRIAVADVGSSQIRFFDSQGRFLSSVGRAGDGPGEFRFMSLVWRLPDDTLVVSDLHGLTIIDPQGAYVRSVQLEPPSNGGRAQPIGQLDDGTIIAMTGTPPGASPPASNRTVRDTLHLQAYGPDGTYRRHLAEVPGAVRWWPSSAPTPIARRVPLSPYPLWAVAGAALHLGSGDDPAIQSLTADGALDRIARWSPPPRALTRDVIARYRDHQLASASNSDARRRLEALLDETPFPDSLPATGEVDFPIDDDGNLWVKAWRAPWDEASSWIILSPDGTWLGTLRTPANFTLHHAGRDFVVGSWRDSLGVEYVRVYDLIKSAGSTTS